MKAAIHPQVFPDAKVTCTACKTVFHIPGTVKEMHVEICSHCHPVYTGKYRGLTISGRVERFQKRLAVAAKASTEVKPKKKRLSAEEKLSLKAKEKAEELAVKREERAEKEHVKKVRAAKKIVTKAAKKKS